MGLLGAAHGWGECGGNFAILTNTDIDCIWYTIFNSFNFFRVFKDYLINIVTILMKTSFKIKVFWNKDYDVITFVNDVINRILSRDSKYIVDGVLWPKVGNCSISMREVLITSIL